MSKKTLSTGVFERWGDDSISPSMFYAIIAFVLVWGFGLTAFLADYAINIGFMPDLLTIIFVGLVVPIIGIIVACKSNNAIISFIGYNLIVGPLGFLLGPVLNQYSPDVVKNALEITFACTVVFGVLGIVFPSFFSKIGRVLFVSLLSLLVIRVLQIFIPSLDFVWIDYLAALLFSLYIGFDMYRANTMQKTFDNAVDICVDFYLDILNLFLIILRILGKSKWNMAGVSQPFFNLICLSIYLVINIFNFYFSISTFSWHFWNNCFINIFFEYWIIIFIFISCHVFFVFVYAFNFSCF